MAIQDILQAITTDADQRIATAQAEHAAALQALRDRQATEQSAQLKQIASEAEQHVFYLRTRAEAQAAMQVRHAVLESKQALIDQVYTGVLSALQALPSAELETFLGTLLKRLPGAGTIRPAQAHAAFLKKHLPAGCTLGETITAEGGFVFISDQYELDMTFPSLVERVLRPATEIDTAHQLFAA